VLAGAGRRGPLSLAAEVGLTGWALPAYPSKIKR